MLFLEQTYLGNTLQDWLIALAVAVAGYLLLRILKSIIVRRFTAFARRTTTDIDDLIADLFRRIKFFFLLAFSLYAGSYALALSPKATQLIETITVIALLLQVAIWGSTIISFWLGRLVKQRVQEDAAGATTLSGLGFVSRLVLWSVILLLALDNAGVNITALLAGLGIGGIAVALAIQNILGDLFASLSIVLDKPFVIGDFIIVNEYLGTVEHIGLKTTRIRSLSGEQIVFSNSDLLNSRVRNFKRMYERRIVFSLGVTYQTPHEKLAAIPAMIRDIIEKEELARFDRAHFKAYGDFSLNFEVVYYVRSPDFNTYMNIQQAINLEIFRRFEENGIEFAYPTRTIIISQDQSELAPKEKS